MARGCYNIQSLHSHRQTHTGTMKSFALVLGRCDITYVDSCVMWRVWSEERLGSSNNSVRSDLHTKWSQATNNPTMTRYNYWGKVTLETGTSNVNNKCFWFHLICFVLHKKCEPFQVVNLAISKKWLLSNLLTICARLFSHHLWGKIFSWPQLMRIGPEDHTAQFAVSQASSLLVIDGLRSFFVCVLFFPLQQC